MRIATYNVNSVDARLSVLLRWLSETQPDIVCLQELKAPRDKSPEKAIRDAGSSWGVFIFRTAIRRLCLSSTTSWDGSSAS